MNHALCCWVSVAECSYVCITLHGTGCLQFCIQHPTCLQDSCNVRNTVHTGCPLTCLSCSCFVAAGLLLALPGLFWVVGAAALLVSLLLPFLSSFDSCCRFSHFAFSSWYICLQGKHEGACIHQTNQLGQRTWKLKCRHTPAKGKSQNLNLNIRGAKNYYLGRVAMFETAIISGMIRNWYCMIEVRDAAFAINFKYRYHYTSAIIESPCSGINACTVTKQNVCLHPHSILQEMV